MSDEQKQEAIHEALGWTPGTFRTFGFGCDGRDMGDLKGWWRGRDFSEDFPDYLNDLNTCAELISNAKTRGFFVTIVNSLVSQEWECVFEDENGYREGQNVSLSRAICDAFLSVLPAPQP